MKRKSTNRHLSYANLENRQLLAADLSIGSDITGVGGETDFNSNAIDVSGDVVLDWNNLFNELLVADSSNQNPGYASRAMAMMNLAIYDAVTLASGDLENTFYEYGEELVEESTRINTDVAVSYAAHTVLESLYPDHEAMIDVFLSESIDSTQQSRRSSASVLLGIEVGDAVLAARADDGSAETVDYVYDGDVGYFQADPLNPDVPVWGPAWGKVDTFAISSAEEFVPGSAPDLVSQQYADSFNEVKELGSVDSTVRTADQTEAGIFWAYDREGLGTPLALFGDVLETVAVQEGNSLEENAALFAQASVAMADAGIVAWQTKFSENFWRPVTAIQQGDADGNDLTEGDAGWTALGAPDGGDDIIGFTPQFPTYISGHATFGGAVFGALQEFYGTDDIAFDLVSEELEILIDNPELQEAYGLELDDAIRSFDSFSEAMAENGRSRVYLGIHFDFDDVVGQEVGLSIAQDVSSEFVVAEANGNDNIPSDRDDQRRQDRRRIAGNNVQRGRGRFDSMRVNEPIVPPAVADSVFASFTADDADLDSFMGRDRVRRSVQKA